MIDLVYLTSANYSGSTLLTFLLNAHPEISTIGELKGAEKDPATHMCSCGEPIGVCPFWCAVLDHLHRAGVPFDHADVWSQCGFRIPDGPFANRIVQHRCRSWPLELARGVYMALSPSCRRHLPRINRTNVAFAQAVLAITGTRWFLDSSKDPIRLKLMRRVPEFRIKVIRMVRDGRGVTNSMMKRLALDATTAALEWRHRELEIDRATVGMAESDILRLKYEDLCQDPDTTLRRTFAFLGVDTQVVIRDFRGPEHHILGNAMRFDSTTDIVEDRKWQRELAPADLTAFEAAAGGVNHALGYSAAATRPRQAVAGS